MMVTIKTIAFASLIAWTLSGCAGEKNKVARTPALETEPPLSTGAVAQWPWIAHGRVTDTQGRPLTGVTIHAGCGWGTLMPTGSATTDADGRYQMRFGPGVVFHGEGGNIDVDRTVRNTNLQAAVIGPHKSGWYEVNFARQGDLLMAVELPGPNDRHAADRERIILPDQPRRIDFVMSPAASLTGQVITPSGKPVKQTRFYIDGGTLRPAASVLGQFTTDDEGRFTFVDIPLESYWFTPADRMKDLRSGPVDFDRPGPHEVVLVLDEQRRELTVNLVGEVVN